MNKTSPPTAKILVVDDDMGNIMVIKTILENKGYDINYAENGKDALKLVQNQPFDLILLDIMMPVMTGYDLCNILKKDEKLASIPVVFLTAKSKPEDIIEGFNVGGVDYITKPFSSDEVLARIKTHIELKRSREVILAQNETLREISASKDKFFRIVGHNLKGPFSVLLGFAEFLHKGINRLTPAEIEDYAQELHMSASHLFKLLDNLLLWSKSQLGIIEIDTESFPIVEQINNQILRMTPEATKKEIEIDFQFDEEYTVLADQYLTDSIIHNLISNALKFSHPKSKVEIKLSALDQSFIQFSIKDNGVGMTEDVKKNIFRIDVYHIQHGTGNEEGTGLGLILAKELVEKQGGKIWFESKPDAGSTFHITLPRSK